VGGGAWPGLGASSSGVGGGTAAAPAQSVEGAEEWTPELAAASVDAVDAGGVPLTALLASRLAGLHMSLVVDPAALRAGCGASQGDALPALTLHLTAPSTGVAGACDAQLCASPGVRLRLALRRAAATLRLGLALRCAGRTCAGLAQRLQGAAADAAPHPLPGCAPAAVLLRAAERHLRGVSGQAYLRLGAQVNDRGELTLEAAGVSGAGAPLVLDVAFKLAEVEEEAGEITAAVAALHSVRTLLDLLPSRTRPLPRPQAEPAAAAPREELVAVEQPQPKKKEQTGFQLPFQNEIGGAVGGLLRAFPGAR